MSSVLLCILREHFSSVCSVQRGGLGLLFLAFEFLRWSAHSQSVISPSAAQHRTLNAFLVYVCVLCFISESYFLLYGSLLCMFSLLGPQKRSRGTFRVYRVSFTFFFFARDFIVSPPAPTSSPVFSVRRTGLWVAFRSSHHLLL